MSKMNHKDKVKLARRLAMRVVNGKPRIVTVRGFGIFGTVAWDMRRLIIAQRVHNKEVQAHYRKLARLDAKRKALEASKVAPTQISQP